MKKTYYLFPQPANIKVGQRFKTLRENDYSDKTFSKNSTAVFLGWTPPQDYGLYFLIMPRFKFDGDNNVNRVLDFDELKKV